MASKRSERQKPAPAKKVTKKAAEKSSAPKKIGRPSLYSEALADEICRRLYESEGDDLPESLRQICRDPKMPGMSTVMDWLKTHSSFSEQYARARELRKDALVDRLLWLSGEAKKHAKGEPGTGEAGAKVAAFKLEIDAIKWILSKEYARDYGDRISQEISGKMETKTTLAISDDLQEKILERTAEAARIASHIEPPASFRGQGSEE